MPITVRFDPVVHYEPTANEEEDDHHHFLYRKTPYPTAEQSNRLRLGSNDSSSANLFQDPNDCFMQQYDDVMYNAENADPQILPPPHKKFAASPPAPEDENEANDEQELADDGDDDDEEEETIHNETWNAVTQELLENPTEAAAYKDRVETFLRGLEQRELAVTALGTLYTRTQESYAAAVDQTLLQQLLVPLHEALTSHVYAAEQELLLHFGRNHQYRREGLAVLRAADQQWKRQHEGFLERYGVVAGAGESDGFGPEMLLEDGMDDDAEEDVSFFTCRVCCLFPLSCLLYYNF